MDPQANLQGQLETSRKIIAACEQEPPWCAEEFGGLSDKWGDEQDRSEYFEALSDELGRLGSRLAELATALDEWRRKGGFDPYPSTAEQEDRDEARGSGVAAEINDNGLVVCGKCGSVEFRYDENIPTSREQANNEDCGLVFRSTPREYDGDDDPGVVCAACETPAELPDDVAIDWTQP